MTFQEAIKHMPRCIEGNFDPLQHKTFADLAWIAQHEIDLSDEHEDSDIRNSRDLASARSYLAEMHKQAGTR